MKDKNLPLFQPEQPDSFSMLEAMVSKVGNIEYNGPYRMVSVRMQLFDYCTVEAMCQYSGQSKNKIVNQMIAACIERLNHELSEEDLEGIQAIRSKLISELLDEETKAQMASGMTAGGSL